MIDRRKFLKGLFGTGIVLANPDTFFKMIEELFAGKPGAMSPSGALAGNMPMIKVLGVGGGGGNAVSAMVKSGIAGVGLISVNTDRQALDMSRVPIKLQIGSRITHGLGAGANADIGRSAAFADADKIRSLLAGSDLVFITAGMGGGIGTGAAPVIAGIAREAKALVIGVVTMPFGFEGMTRRNKAETGLVELEKNVDALIVIPNDRLLDLTDKKMTLLDSFQLADSVINRAITGISDVVMLPGYVNIDFADINTMMSNSGHAAVGTGAAIGKDSAATAARQAIASPQLNHGTMKRATGALINITGGNDLGINEVSEAVSIIKSELGPKAHILFGVVIDPSMNNEIKVTVIANGLPSFESGRIKEMSHMLIFRDGPKTEADEIR
jgi:cell division protein FtsZ